MVVTLQNLEKFKGTEYLHKALYIHVGHLKIFVLLLESLVNNIQVLYKWLILCFSSVIPKIYDGCSNRFLFSIFLHYLLITVMIMKLSFFLFICPEQEIDLKSVVGIKVWKTCSRFIQLLIINSCLSSGNCF